MLDEAAVRVADRLADVLAGRVVVATDPDYEQVRAVWNGAVEHRPAMIALCESSRDVRQAVLAARAHRLPLSVRGGGHDWAGRALCPGGMVIDLTRMRAVLVDPAGRVATALGGATSGDAALAASRYRLTPVIGTVSMVGLAGLSLGGGYSPLAPRYGLAADNLLGVQLVLADGRVVTADESTNPDLFWAVRGGGGNFGVVTAMRIRMHPVATVVSGAIVFQWSRAESVLRDHSELSSSAPDELGMVGGIFRTQDGEPALTLSPVWCGDAAEGARHLARLGAPAGQTFRTLPLHRTLAVPDARLPNGRHYEIRTRSLATLTPAAIDALMRAGSDLPSSTSVITWQYLRGAAARVPATATAFALRREHFMIQIIASWAPSEDGAPHRAWAAELDRALAREALPGGYPNLLAVDALDQIAGAYGDNAERLQRIKWDVDPDRVFTATPLPPS